MRSRIIKTVPETVIAYKTDEYTQKLHRIASSNNIKLTEAAADSAGEAVGYLAGYAGFTSNGSSEEAEDSCIVFAGLSSRQIDSFLSDMRKNGVSVPLKAVVTASNQSWSLKKLLSELKKEREKLGG